MRGLLQVDSYTIVIDKINYWEIEHYSTNSYLTVYLDNDKSIEIKKTLSDYKIRPKSTIFVVYRISGN